MMDYNRLETYFKKKRWYISRDQLIKYGISRNSLQILIKKGAILKISDKIYRWKDVNLGGYDELFDISHIEPKGVFCLYTAFNLYDLTTFVSNMYYISIPRNNWVAKGLDQYPIKVKKWKDSYFDLGIDLIKIGKYSIRLYNLEKTVCDCVRFRNEIGLNTVKEVLTSYLERNDKNLKKLSLYAETLGVSKILKDYMGMLL